MTSQDREKVIPLWCFIFASRKRMDEQAYREYYLDNDIRNCCTTFYVIFVLMLALMTAELVNENVRHSIIVLYSSEAIICLFIIQVMKSARSSLVLDRCAIIFWIISNLLFVNSHLVTYILPSVAIVRIDIILICSQFIFFQIYASKMAIPVAMLLIGDGYLLYGSDRPDMASESSIVAIYMPLAIIFLVMASAYRQRSRYLFFRAISQVNQLSGLLPICSGCKKIRNDGGYFQQIEHYISEHSEAEFTHAYCPDCATALFPELTLSGE